MHSRILKFWTFIIWILSSWSCLLGLMLTTPWRLLWTPSCTLTWSPQSASGKQPKTLYLVAPSLYCFRYWQRQEAGLIQKGSIGKAFLEVIKKWVLDPFLVSVCVELAVWWNVESKWFCYFLILLVVQTIDVYFFRYLTPPATSTCVERLFSAAGLIMDVKRNRLSPARLNNLLFLRENFLLGICGLQWW